MFPQHASRPQRRNKDKPYVGATPLQLGDPIFGRDQDLSRLSELLISERIVVLHSPSGAGKSSLINAGLIPELEARRFATLQPIRAGRLDMLPGCSGGRFVGNVLHHWNAEMPRGQRLPEPALANTTLREFSETAGRDEQGRFRGLIFDQFEEVVTSAPGDSSAVHAFFEQLGDLLDDREVWALFAIREDYLGHLEPFREYIPGGWRQRYRLDLLTEEDAVDAICGPLRGDDSKVRFDEAAALELARRFRLRRDPLTGQFVPGRYVEPVILQVVCTEIWDALPAGTADITAEHLPGEHEISQSLAGFYNRLIGKAATAAVPEARIRSWVEEELIEGDRRAQTLKGPTQTVDDKPVLEELVNGYLLRQDIRSDNVWYELAHDRMVEAVRAGNLQYQLTLPVEQQFLHRRAAEWQRSGQDDDLLLRGHELASVTRWVTSVALLPEPDRTFLQRSLKLRAQRRREKRWTTIALVAIACGVIGVVWAMGYARKEISEADQWARQRADEAKTDAARVADQAKKDANSILENATKMVAAAERKADEVIKAAQDRVRSADLSLRKAQQEAEKVRKDLERTEASEKEASAKVAAAQVELEKAAKNLENAKSEIVETQRKGEEAARLLEDRALMRSAALNAQRDLRTRPIEAARRLIEAIRSAVTRSSVIDPFAAETLTPALQATMYADVIDAGAPGAGIARTSSGGVLQVLNQDGSAATYTASADGSLRVTEGGCRVYRLCPVSGGYELKSAQCGEKVGGCAQPMEPTSVALSPDGTKGAFGFYDGRLFVLDFPSGQAIEAPKHRHPVQRLAFRPDAKRLASISALWSFAITDLEKTEADRLMRKPSLLRWINIVIRGGSSESIRSAAFVDNRPDMLALGFEDGRLEIWDLQQKKAVARSRLHERAVTVVASNSAGTLLITGSTDGQVKIAPVTQTPVRRDLPSRSALAKTQVAAERTLGTYRGELTAVAFSPDSKLAVMSAEDGSIHLKDVATGEELASLQGHAGRVRALRFLEPDLLASASDDRAIRFWKLYSHAQLRELRKILSALESLTITRRGPGADYVPLSEGRKAALLDLLSRAERLVAPRLGNTAAH